MDKNSIAFLVGAVVITVLVSVGGFSLAALPEDVAEMARAPVPAEQLGFVEVGDGFGEIAVTDLLGYWLENPPVTAAVGAAPAEPERRFGGC